MKFINFREVPLSEISDLPVYPVANILPKLEKVATKRDDGKNETLTLSELADSIIEHGQHSAIVLYSGQILDGRNRRWACEMAAKTEKKTHDEFMVLVEDFEGTEDEATEFVFTAGLDRRDLDPTQRGMSAARFEFNPGTRPMFEQMKAKARGAQGTRTDLQPLTTEWSEVDDENNRAIVIDMLSDRFRVSKGYIIDARKILKDEQAASEAAERAAQRAEEYELAEEEAKEALQEAVTTGDKDTARAANMQANNAQMHKIEEREKAAELANKAAKLGSLAEDLHEGRKNLSQVRKEKKEEGKDEREIAIDKAVQGFNDGYNKVTKNGPFLLKEGRPNDQENVRLKFSHMCEKFGELEEIEGSRQTEHYFSTEKIPSDEHNRWGGEVRMRLAGVDRMIQERGVLPKTVTNDPEFVGVIDRLREFLDEVETNIHNQEV